MKSLPEWAGGFGCTACARAVEMYLPPGTWSRSNIRWCPAVRTRSRAVGFCSEAVVFDSKRSQQVTAAITAVAAHLLLKSTRARILPHTGDIVETGLELSGLRTAASATTKPRVSSTEPRCG